MQMTETKARAGADVSPVQEVKQAVTGFVSDFKSFREDIQAKLQQQDERLTMLDRKSKLAARTPLATAAEIHAPHMKAFGEYLRTGDDDGLRGLEFETKSMSTLANSDGRLPCRSADLGAYPVGVAVDGVAAGRGLGGDGGIDQL